MDVKYINPALDSIVNVLKTMAGISPVIGKASVKNEQNAPGIVTTGLIDLVGVETTGSLAISFSRPVALEISKNMLRIETDDIDDMVLDLVGEMANMMAGGAKAIFEQQGYHFNLTLPSVLGGENHQIKHNVNGITILLPFTTERVNFLLRHVLLN